MHTIYLNNSGSKWRNFDRVTNKAERITLTTKSGKEVTRTVCYWQQWGNFAVAIINYKGETIKVSTDSVLED